MKRRNVQQIAIKAKVTKQKSEDFQFIDSAAGFSPFLRGIETTMYVNKPLHIVLSYNFKSENNILINNPKKSHSQPEIDLANILLNGATYIQKKIKNGGKFDVILSKILFSWTVSNNHFVEIAKMRAARIVWVKLMQQIYPNQQQPFAFKIYCPIENSFSNTQQTIKLLTSILGGVQILHLESTKIATYIEEETLITKTIDPWAGSSYLEKLTFEIANNTWEILQSYK